MLALHVEDIESMTDEDAFLEVHSDAPWAQVRVACGLTFPERAGIKTKLYRKRSAEFDDEMKSKFGDN